MRNYCLCAIYASKGPCHSSPCLANLLTLWRKRHASAGDVTTWSTPRPESVSRIFTIHLILFNSAANWNMCCMALCFSAKALLSPIRHGTRVADAR